MLSRVCLLYKIHKIDSKVPVNMFMLITTRKLQCKLDTFYLKAQRCGLKTFIFL